MCDRASSARSSAWRCPPAVRRRWMRVALDIFPYRSICFLQRPKTCIRLRYFCCACKKFIILSHSFHLHSMPIPSRPRSPVASAARRRARVERRRGRVGLFRRFRARGQQGRGRALGQLSCAPLRSGRYGQPVYKEDARARTGVGAGAASRSRGCRYRWGRRH